MLPPGLKGDRPFYIRQGPSDASIVTRNGHVIGSRDKNPISDGRATTAGQDEITYCGDLVGRRLFRGRQ